MMITVVILGIIVIAGMGGYLAYVASHIDALLPISRNTEDLYSILWVTNLVSFCSSVYFMFSSTIYDFLPVLLFIAIVSLLFVILTPMLMNKVSKINERLVK